jgi:hypothetical protein
MVNLPFPVRADAATMRRLKRRLHDAVEGVLDQVFIFDGYSMGVYGARRTPPTMILKGEKE